MERLSLDVKNALVNDKLEEEVHVCTPEAFCRKKV